MEMSQNLIFRESAGTLCSINNRILFIPIAGSRSSTPLDLTGYVGYERLNEKEKTVSLNVLPLCLTLNG